MTAFDVDAAAARHHAYTGEGRLRGKCATCTNVWPCDAAQALDVIRELMMERDFWHGVNDATVRRAADAIILRNRVAELEAQLREAQK